MATHYWSTHSYDVVDFHDDLFMVAFDALRRREELELQVIWVKSVDFDSEFEGSERRPGESCETPEHAKRLLALLLPDRVVLERASSPPGGLDQIVTGSCSLDGSPETCFKLQIPLGRQARQQSLGLLVVTVRNQRR